MSHYQTQVEQIRYHETTAANLREALYADIEILFTEGLVSRPADEDPVKATGKFVAKLLAGAVISAADVKEKVPSTRDLTHRGITSLLSHHPALVEHEERDRHGLKCFRRIDEQLPMTLAAPTEQPMQAAAD